MRRQLSYILLSFFLIAFSNIEAHAVKAWPYPIVVTQPDGSKITIQQHGDEFFSWTTSDGKIVEKGADGFYRETTISLADRIKAMEKRQMSVRHNLRPMSVSDDDSAIGNPISHGENHFLVLLIEFNDLEFTVSDPAVAFHNLLNQEGYSANNSTGSARDYFRDQSGDKFQPHFDVVGPIKVNRPMSYYSADKGMTQEKGAPRLLQDACEILLKEGFDFSAYDIDKDHVIDNIFFFYAGHNMAEGASGTIWPHKWQVNSFPSLNGTYLWTYACTSEFRLNQGQVMCSIGTFCHEFGHVIGLPDFYDVNDTEEGKVSNDPGIYSLMSGGSYNNEGKTPPNFNLEEKALLGWLPGTQSLSRPEAIVQGWTHISELPKENGIYTFGPVWKNEGFISKTANENEYFIYEYRDGSGWDQPIGKGVLIYHVDKSENMAGYYTANARWTDNGFSGCINDAGSHPCFKLISSANTGTSMNTPFGNNVKYFTSKTTPAAKDWSGQATHYNLSNISYDGTEATIMLSYDAPGSAFKVNAIDIRKNQWQAGEVFNFVLLPSDREIEQTDWYFDSTQMTEDSIVLSAGKHKIEARISYINGDTAWYIAEINVN